MSVSTNEALNSLKQKSFFQQLKLSDWLWATLLVLGIAYSLNLYYSVLDYYEVGILLGVGVAALFLGWHWKPSRLLIFLVTVFSLLSILIYSIKLQGLPKELVGREALIALANDKPHYSFFLKYFLSSTSATLWMCTLFVFAAIVYFVALFFSSRPGMQQSLGKFATAFTWTAVGFGLVALMVRWRESYLISPDIGHIPVSNLYEVFILFSIITALIYLYYEAAYKTKALGAYVLLIITGAIGFIIWYQFSGVTGHEIQPLLPALQSWWMKIHVPANFVGYGAFALAAMVGALYLLNHYSQHPSRKAALFGAGLTFAFAFFFGLYKAAVFESIGGNKVFKHFDWSATSIPVSLAIGLLLVIIGWVTVKNKSVQASMPDNEVLESIQYKSIALGFAFFTVATILGALWAAEAWGAPWSWDPKEVWALIIWLNYAAWLHMRLLAGVRGVPTAWWSVIGLFITTFGFLGVNVFLSGLHVYGEIK